MAGALDVGAIDEFTVGISVEPADAKALVPGAAFDDGGVQRLDIREDV
jgi:hypothetical protein